MSLGSRRIPADPPKFSTPPGLPTRNGAFRSYFAVLLDGVGVRPHALETIGDNVGGKLFVSCAEAIREDVCADVVSLREPSRPSEEIRATEDPELELSERSTGTSSQKTGCSSVVSRGDTMLHAQRWN
jgi:hypothetical protein